MFGALSDWVEQASDMVKEITEQGAELAHQVGLLGDEDRSSPTGTDALPSPPAAAAAAAATPPCRVSLSSVKMAPPGWTASGEEWTFLVNAALSDGHFCSVPGARVVDTPVLWDEAKSLLSVSDDEDAELRRRAAAEAEREPDADIAAWLPTAATVYAAYARLVPLNIDEEQYWGTVGWKVALCRRCADPSVLLSLAKVLASAPGEEGVSLDEEYWATTAAGLQSLQEGLQWRASLEAEVKKEMELAAGNVKLLRNLIAKGDVKSELANSVAESCVFYKVKLAKLLGEVEKDQDKLQGSSLSPVGGETGTLYAALLEANEEVKRVTDAYENGRHGSPTHSQPQAPVSPTHDTGAAQDAGQQLSRKESSVAESASQRSPTTPHQEADPTTESNNNELPTAQEAHAPVAAQASPAPPATLSSDFEDVAFEAKMPWDDGEDDATD